MTSTDREQFAPGDDPAAVLACVRSARRAEEDQARRVMLAAARWAAMHSAESVVTADEWTDGRETMLPLGGAGCPAVAEFCVAELAATLGRSTESGRRYLAGVVEVRYRLPHLWARIEAGEVPAWKALAIAEQTMLLNTSAAGFVDESIHWCVDKLRHAALARLVEEAIVRFDPETADQRRRDAADHRHFDIELDQTDFDGTVRVDGQLDYADARDLEAALSRGAEHLKELGSTESLDVRRSVAAGELARRDLTLDLAPAERATPARQVVIHAHLPASVFTRPETDESGGSDLARIEETGGFVSAEQVRLWCNGDAQVVLKPVIDLADHHATDAYEIPDRLAGQADLRDRHCVHPYCTRRARRCDHDHVVAHAHGGRTCSCNLAPLCRSHHRLKTHARRGGWHYYVLEPGRYLWTSPHGYQFLVDHHGTTDVSRDLRPEIELGDGCLDHIDPPER